MTFSLDLDHVFEAGKYYSAEGRRVGDHGQGDGAPSQSRFQWPAGGFTLTSTSTLTLANLQPLDQKHRADGMRSCCCGRQAVAVFGLDGCNRRKRGFRQRLSGRFGPQ